MQAGTLLVVSSAPDVAGWGGTLAQVATEASASGSPPASRFGWGPLSRLRAPNHVPPTVPHLPPVALSRTKRLVDAAFAAVALLLLFPLLLIAAAAVVFDGGWPPLFAQERIGLEGQRFRMWKFRTMVNGAEGMRDSLAHLNEAPFPAFKVTNDPRVTRLGRLLRRSSLDELPQLWNVMRGEMSLVGPRPALPEEVRHYDAFALRRLAARPGITGMWQIENRNRSNGHFQDWVQKDLAYVDSWSPWLDVVLFAKTLAAIARMTGR
jgi:lipopolysaccharide/colanic/teichoic acid biosynthesis glycosyltransferase